MFSLRIPAAALGLMLFSSTAWCDFINEDIQIVAANATDFEILLRGNRVNQIGDKFISPFNNGAAVNFNALNNVTVIQFNAPAGMHFGAGTNHFGFNLAGAPASENGFGEGVIAKLISFDGNPGPLEPPLPVPAPDVVFGGIINNGRETVSIENLSTDTVSLYQVGYLVTSSALSLDSLNRTTLPPSAFISAGIPDGTQLAPGATYSFDVPLAAGQYITVFNNSQFSGPSSGNAYTGQMGAWVETLAVPEPDSLALIGFALITLACLGRNRRIDIMSKE